MDYRTAPTTDDEAVLYIPQSVAAQGLYQCHRQLGRGILESMGRVLSAVVGEEWQE